MRTKIIFCDTWRYRFCYYHQKLCEIINRTHFSFPPRILHNQHPIPQHGSSNISPFIDYDDRDPRSHPRPGGIPLPLARILLPRPTPTHVRRRRRRAWSRSGNRGGGAPRRRPRANDYDDDGHPRVNGGRIDGRCHVGGGRNHVVVSLGGSRRRRGAWDADEEGDGRQLSGLRPVRRQRTVRDAIISGRSTRLFMSHSTCHPSLLFLRENETKQNNYRSHRIARVLVSHMPCFKDSGGDRRGVGMVAHQGVSAVSELRR